MNNESEPKFSARSDLGKRMRGLKISGEQLLAILFLLFAVGFNLWLYRLEPTAKIDPNDNLFQYALVERTNEIWDFANRTCGKNILTFIPCHLSYLADHWVPNWNEGYNLPFYYSHIPQIVIVGSWRFFSTLSPIPFTLFAYYHLIIYLLLCLFPISMFFALRIAGFSWLTAGFGALLGSQISTDGLYGLDPPSFLWRGYGLSSQLFAMVWLPVAIAYSYRYVKDKKYLVPAVVFLIFTTAGHIGVGIMAFLSLLPLMYAEPLFAILKQQWNNTHVNLIKINTYKLILLSGLAIFFLSYWIIPAFLSDNFHNFSFWDPIWKFNSYGSTEILARLGNGDLFDFGRLPIFTGLVLIGAFAFPRFGLLFLFWLLLYFGRTTWGNLINIIPSMREFHLSRFIVGVHLSGLFLAPIGITWLISKFKQYKFIAIALGLLLLFPVYRQTVTYNTLNDTLIKQANGNYAKQIEGAQALVSEIAALEKSNPGRVYSGRGGGWGKDFHIAETNMVMYLGNFGIPTVLWLPETWSPNGDTEQYFREDKQEDYDLFNMRYVATPATIQKDTILPFWKLIREHPSWKLYEVPTSGYFTKGIRPAVVASDKYSRTNVVRLWIQSDDPKNGLYPQLTFDTKKYPVNTGIPNFKMTDEVTYTTPGGTSHNLFSEPPKYQADVSKLKNLSLTNETNDADMIFTAHASVPAECHECMIILKQSYHPNWQVTIDGKRVTPIITFPFYIGIPVSPGAHIIEATYVPSLLKRLLGIVTILGGLTILNFLRKLTI